MLFSSPEFALAFLPVVLVVYFAAARLASQQVAIAWLVVASLFFYGWWKPAYLILLLGSIAVNYAIGRILSRGPSRIVLGLGIGLNLALIGAYKYADFFIVSVNRLSASDFPALELILPLAISFFTFQQIAYLVDVHQGRVRDASFLHYTLFVTFFPQLIAGPIVHHSETIPQFEKPAASTEAWRNVSIGLTIFIIGLYKKIVFADGMGIYANLVFDAADAGDHISAVTAWGGVLAYALQIYFDFSGYSDMAIGLARMFGIKLPLNFASPYKAVNIIEFWRRWHITLSRFLRVYLYIPLGGNRKGPGRRHVNLMITMLLGGLWHGAGWNFVLWGGLHGLFLVINHLWHRIRRALGHDMDRSSVWGRSAARAVTFLAVVAAWVFFRADSTDGAVNILTGMAGLTETGTGGVIPIRSSAMIWIAVLLAIAWFAPNTQQWMARFEPALDYAHGDAPKNRIFTALQAHQTTWMTPFIGVSIVVGSLIMIARSDAPIFIYMVF